MLSSKFILWILISILLLLLTITYFYNTSTLKTSFNYNWILGIAILNMVNIIIVRAYYIYYDRKNNVYGSKGRKGKQGKRGKRGKYITCSYCLTNIYAEKTKEYAPIAEIKLLDPTNLIKGNERISNILDNIDNIDIIKTNSIYNNLQNKIMKYDSNEDLETMANISVYDVNKAKKLYIQRPTGKVGYFAIGDTITAASNYKAGKNGFVISGDIRNPNSYKLISAMLIQDENAQNDDATENNIEDNTGDYTEYGIWSVNAPDGFVSLGDIVSYKKPSLTSIACVNAKCVYKIDKSPANLSYGGTYYYINNKTKLNNNSNYNSNSNTKFYDEYTNEYNQNENEDYEDEEENLDNDNNNNNKKEIIFIGFWITLLNTLIVNVCNNKSIINNTLAYNILNGNSYYLNEIGDITDQGYLYIKSRLNNIKISKIFTTFYISSYYSQYYNKQLEIYFNVNKSQLESLNADDREKAIKTKINGYKKKLDNISVIIDEMENLYDMSNKLLGKLETSIIKNDMLNIQIDFLKLLKSLFPPNKNVYMIKNECLAYNRIDETRQINIKKLTEILDIYDDNMTKLDDNETIQNLIRNTEDTLSKNLNHIQNWGIKIANRDLTDFTNERINYLIDIYTNIIEKMNIN